MQKFVRDLREDRSEEGKCFFRVGLAILIQEQAMAETYQGNP